MNEQWERQKLEIDSYNTFYSAIKGEITGEGLLDLGYRLVGRFLTVPDLRNDVKAKPDFVLYDGTTLLLVEVKSGNNISNRTIEQMERCNNLSIEAAQDFLKESSFNSPNRDPDDLRNIQSCIVYYDDNIEECRKHESCVEALNELEKHAAILTQQKGDTLQLDSGPVVDKELENTLSSGLQLPEAPDKNIYLTEGVELECLAFSVCHDCVVNNMAHGRLSLSPSGVRERYQNRSIPMDRVRTVFRFLDEIGACRKTDNGEYEFTHAHMGTIVSVQDYLADKPVDEWIDDTSDSQVGLDDFI